MGMLLTGAGALAGGLTIEACSIDITSGEPGDASVDAAPSVDTGPLTDVTVRPPSEGGSVEDASRDANASPIDAALMSDGAVFSSRIVADVPGMSDFDLTATMLAVRIGSSFSTCALPGCATPTVVPNTAEANGLFSIAGDRLYFSARPAGTIQDNVFSIAFDGSDLQNRTNHVVAGGPTESFLGAVSFHGGLTRVEQMVSFSRSAEAGYRTLVEITSGASGNAYRVGRATANVHENEGSVVRYFPAQMAFQVTENNPGRVITPPAMTLNGASILAPTTNPTAIATTPVGAGTLHPMVVIRAAGGLKACPTASNCLAWIDLGASVSADVFALDGQNLYLGSAAGLAKCALAEIATMGRCTPRLMLPRALVQAPMVVTADEVIFKSGTRIIAAPKAMGGVCPVGSGFRAGACTPCLAGEEPSPSTGECRACPRGSYASAPGAAMCTACGNGTSTGAAGSTAAAACVACPAGEVSNVRTGHLCVPAGPRRIFLTTERHDGNFAGDATLPGANAFEKADAFCMQSTSRPDDVPFKAFLVDGVLRDAPSRTDWVLAPLTAYVQADGTTPIGTTNAAALLPFPLTNPFVSGIPRAYDYFWSGITATTWASLVPTRNCDGWSTTTTGFLGTRGIPGRTDNSALGATGSTACANSAFMVCVEQ